MYVYPLKAIQRQCVLILTISKPRYDIDFELLSSMETINVNVIGGEKPIKLSYIDSFYIFNADTTQFV